MVWKRKITPEVLNVMGEGNVVGSLDIHFEHIGDDTLEATVPVDSRTKQPSGLLHEGAPMVLAESIGLVAGYLCIEGEQKVVGLEINANHVRSARGGRVRDVRKPLYPGSRHQVWQAEVFDGKGRLCCSSRLTTAILRRRHQKSATCIAFGYYLHSKRWYTVQVLSKSEDAISTQLDSIQLAIEFLCRDQSNLSPAQHLKRLKQPEFEFADLLTLSSAESKEEIYSAWRLGVY